MWHFVRGFQINSAGIINKRTLWLMCVDFVSLKGEVATCPRGSRVPRVADRHSCKTSLHCESNEWRIQYCMLWIKNVLKKMPPVRLELTTFRLWDWRAADCAKEATECVFLILTTWLCITCTYTSFIPTERILSSDNCTWINHTPLGPAGAP